MQPAATPAPRSRRPRLLVVEDEVSTLFALRSFFAPTGYDVDCAAGPNDAVLLLERNQYEAVITDLHLTPARRGEGMAIALAARARNPRACIVLLTAYGAQSTEDEARRSGVDVYRTKPVELPRLTFDIERVRHGYAAAALQTDHV
jgi:two-component system, chemotaxis family, sensor kinase CheA